MLINAFILSPFQAIVVLVEANRRYVAAVYSAGSYTPAGEPTRCGAQKHVSVPIQNAKTLYRRASPASAPSKSLDRFFCTSILFSHCVLRYSLRPKPAVARLCGFLTVADAPAGTPDAARGPSPDTQLRHVVL